MSAAWEFSDDQWHPPVPNELTPAWRDEQGPCGLSPEEQRIALFLCCVERE